MHSLLLAVSLFSGNSMTQHFVPEGRLNGRPIAVRDSGDLAGVSTLMKTTNDETHDEKHESHCFVALKQELPFSFLRAEEERKQWDREIQNTPNLPDSVFDGGIGRGNAAGVNGSQQRLILLRDFISKAKTTDRFSDSLEFKKRLAIIYSGLSETQAYNLNELYDERYSDKFTGESVGLTVSDLLRRTTSRSTNLTSGMFSTRTVELQSDQQFVYDLMNGMTNEKLLGWKRRADRSRWQDIVAVNTALSALGALTFGDQLAINERVKRIYKYTKRKRDETVLIDGIPVFPPNSVGPTRSKPSFRRQKFSNADLFSAGIYGAFAAASTNEVLSQTTVERDNYALLLAVTPPDNLTAVFSDGMDLPMLRGGQPQLQDVEAKILKVIEKQHMEDYCSKAGLLTESSLVRRVEFVNRIRSDLYAPAVYKALLSSLRQGALAKSDAENAVKATPGLWKGLNRTCGGELVSIIRKADYGDAEKQALLMTIFQIDDSSVVKYHKALMKSAGNYDPFELSGLRQELRLMGSETDSADQKAMLEAIDAVVTLRFSKEPKELFLEADLDDTAKLFAFLTLKDIELTDVVREYNPRSEDYEIRVTTGGSLTALIRQVVLATDELKPAHDQLLNELPVLLDSLFLAKQAEAYFTKSIREAEAVELSQQMRDVVFNHYFLTTVSERTKNNLAGELRNSGKAEDVLSDDKIKALDSEVVIALKAGAFPGSVVVFTDTNLSIDLRAELLSHRFFAADPSFIKYSELEKISAAEASSPAQYSKAFGEFLDSFESLQDFNNYVNLLGTLSQKDVFVELKRLTSDNRFQQGQLNNIQKRKLVVFGIASE